MMIFLLTNAMFVKRSKKFKKVSNTHLSVGGEGEEKRRKLQMKQTREHTQFAKIKRERNVVRSTEKTRIREFEFNTQAIRSRK